MAYDSANYTSSSRPMHRFSLSRDEHKPDAPAPGLRESPPCWRVWRVGFVLLRLSRGERKRSVCCGQHPERSLWLSRCKNLIVLDELHDEVEAVQGHHAEDDAGNRQNSPGGAGLEEAEQADDEGDKKHI